MVYVFTFPHKGYVLDLFTMHSQVIWIGHRILLHTSKCAVFCDFIYNSIWVLKAEKLADLLHGSLFILWMHKILKGKLLSKGMGTWNTNDENKHEIQTPNCVIDFQTRTFRLRPKWLYTINFAYVFVIYFRFSNSPTKPLVTASPTTAFQL